MAESTREKSWEMANRAPVLTLGLIRKMPSS
jgi:hypothetical protein